MKCRVAGAQTHLDLEEPTSELDPQRPPCGPSRLGLADPQYVLAPWGAAMNKVSFWASVASSSG